MRERDHPALVVANQADEQWRRLSPAEQRLVEVAYTAERFTALPHKEKRKVAYALEKFSRI